MNDPFESRFERWEKRHRVVIPYGKRHCKAWIEREIVFCSKAYIKNATYSALKKGLIVRTPCEECGVQSNPEQKVDAHHDNYNRPLSVRWLCRRHHYIWHLNNEPVQIETELLLMKPSAYIRIGLEQIYNENISDQREIIS